VNAKTTDLLADPFGERSIAGNRRDLYVLGARVRFESNSEELMRLVDAAYAGLPRHRLSRLTPSLRVRLMLTSSARKRARSEPAPLQMMSAAGLIGAATESSNFMVISPEDRGALVAVSPQMLRFPYHTRYELIEFAVFTLATRVQGLVALHAGCVGNAGRGILLMGPSGAGKSTLTLQCLFDGVGFLAEDSVFVTPDTLLATGVSNYLHVRADSLRWVAEARRVARIRKSPVIVRRSGMRKYEVDLRGGEYSLATRPLKIGAVVFLSEQHAAENRGLLKRLSRAEALPRLVQEQAYAANQPSWSAFSRAAARLPFFELRRGRHPSEAVAVLRELIKTPGAPAPAAR
jgi:hypothetical protein